ncbi:MAG: hypothetical protein JO015_03070 [Verrucomicrobia bacterium]|nr:hypothetical protein [Verrucomicrobiota bacterium]
MYNRLSLSVVTVWKLTRDMRAPLRRAGLVLSLMSVAGCERRTVQVYDVPKPPSSQTELMAAGLVAPGPAPAAAVKWTTPANWQEQPLSEMRQGSFRASGPDGANADISVVSFPGTAGGLASNLNRWRGQVELPPASDEELRQATQPVQAGPVEGILVDYASPPQSAKPSRILGAVLETPDRTWFVKMTGPPAFVETQKETFAQFVQSFQFSQVSSEGEPGAPGRPKSSNDQ